MIIYYNDYLDIHITHVDMYSYRFKGATCSQCYFYTRLNLSQHVGCDELGAMDCCTPNANSDRVFLEVIEV